MNDANRAWVALALNLAILPGLGTLFLRRWLTGVVQLAMTMSGAVAFLLWLVAWVREWNRMGSFPLDRGPLFPYALAGFAALVSAWLWCARSGWTAARAARSPAGG